MLFVCVLCLITIQCKHNELEKELQKMATYLFETITTMKAHNNKNWWIDRDIIRKKAINAESLKEALKEYQTEVSEEDFITISDNALKNKSPMYVDTKSGESKQVGYVITGKTEFQRDDYTWSIQYVDLWVNISLIDIPEF